MAGDVRGSMPLVGALVVIGVVVAAGVGGAVGLDATQVTDAGTETTTATPTATATQTATATATATATPSATATSEAKNVTVIIEHWGDKVGIIIQGGADADAVTEIRVEGATMNATMDLDARYPRAKGTVTGETVRVIATFEDGTEQVIAERTLG